MKMDVGDASHILQHCDSRETPAQQRIAEELLDEGESAEYYQGYLTALTLAILCVHCSSKNSALSFFAALGKRACKLYLC